MTSNSGNPSKIAGQWHAAKGEVKHGLGRTFASSNLQQEGQDERQAGREQINAARGQGMDSGGARYDGAGNDYGSGWNQTHDQQYGQQYGQQMDSGVTGNSTIPGTAAGSGADMPLGGDNSSYPDDEGPTTGSRNPGFNAFAPGGVPMGPGPQRLQGDQPGQGNTADQSRQAQQNMDQWNRDAF